MKNKNLAALISALVCLAAFVAAVIIFQRQIAEGFAALKGWLRERREARSTETQFTPEEIEVFADI